MSIVFHREMDIEYEVRCDDDFVSFYDGDSMMSPSIPGTSHDVYEFILF